jgi:hypothetical protein
MQGAWVPLERVAQAFQVEPAVTLTEEHVTTVVPAHDDVLWLSGEEEPGGSCHCCYSDRRVRAILPAAFPLSIFSIDSDPIEKS